MQKILIDMHPLGMPWATMHEQLHLLQVVYSCLGICWQK